MSNSKSHIFSFPGLYNGAQFNITIVENEGQYEVLLDNCLTAQLGLNGDGHTWYVMDGELDDEDLVREIGERIEAHYY